MRALWLATVFGWTALAQPSVEIPYYPETTPIQVGDELIIGGEHFRISYFTTKDPVESVAKYFFDKTNEHLKGISNGRVRVKDITIWETDTTTARYSE